MKTTLQQRLMSAASPFKALMSFAILATISYTFPLEMVLLGVLDLLWQHLKIIRMAFVVASQDIIIRILVNQCLRETYRILLQE